MAKQEHFVINYILLAIEIKQILRNLLTAITDSMMTLGFIIMIEAPLFKGKKFVKIGELSITSFPIGQNLNQMLLVGTIFQILHISVLQINLGWDAI